MVIAMFCAGMAAIPRMLGPVKSMIFFARIKEQSVADYVDQFAQLIITTSDGMAVHAEGLSMKELERVLEQARSLTAVDTSEDSSAKPDKIPV